MAKPAVRSLIQLRKSLDRLEADVSENERQRNLASRSAISELGSTVGSEFTVKFAGETWKLRHEMDGMKVYPLVLDEDI